MDPLFEPLPLPRRGAVLANRLVLAPLTNTQSHDDGTLSEDEYRWLTLRAQGGFAATMTCASHVQAAGRGFKGQLGNYSELHLPGLSRLAAGIKAAGSLALTQLHHAGIRAPSALIGGRPLGPSDDAETGARAMTSVEVQQVRDDFISAAQRAQRAGFDGVEVHGAHGYLLCQFLSPVINRREDDYGGTQDHRARLLMEVVEGIRQACGEDFLVGVRLSPERFGLELLEIRELAARLLRGGLIDFLDLSLWDVDKEPEDTAHRGRSLLSWFTELDRGDVRLGAAGNILSGQAARRCLESDVDFLLIGRAAVLHHDFPNRLLADPEFQAIATPVTEAYLRDEGLGPDMIQYMRRWEGFVT
ncbi:MAG: NADH:flavin oxidoreductase [Steroidobacteraceae bacterium]